MLKHILKRFVVPVFLLSLVLNAILIFQYFYESKKEEEELGVAVQHVMLNINEAVNLLNNLDEKNQQIIRTV